MFWIPWAISHERILHSKYKQELSFPRLHPLSYKSLVELRNLPKNKSNYSPDIGLIWCYFNLQLSKLQLAIRLLIFHNHSFLLHKTCHRQNNYRLSAPSSPLSFLQLSLLTLNYQIELYQLQSLLLQSTRTLQYISITEIKITTLIMLT